VGFVLIGAATTTAVLVAASVRLPSLVSTLLVAYLAFVANLGLVTWGLSPFREVTRAGLTGAEAVLLAGALAVWWRRGRPRWPLAAARAMVRELLGEIPAALFLAAVIMLLAYELVLVLTAPPNNWDSLTYHLARTAAWVHHGGIHWISNAPTPNFNEYAPLAEQQILFYFVATGKGALFALPQYLGELAILVAVYGISRRLGFGVRAAACSSFLLATLSFVALQATTAQNDLFAASFPAVAACLILGGSWLELALAGAAAGMGLGAKPTTALVLPVLLWLVLLRGRRALVTALGGGAVGFAAIGMWVYVFNLAHTGNLFGQGGWMKIGAPDQQPARPGNLATAVDVVYQMFDLAILSDTDIRLLWIAGVVTTVGAAAYALRRRLTPGALADVATVGVPFFSPLLVIGGGGIVAWLASRWGFPVRGSGSNVGGINRTINGCTFGPVGAIALLGVPLVTFAAYARRRVDARYLALGAALPIFLVLLSFATYNWFLTRFLLVPAVLTAPLFAFFFRTRAAIGAFLVVSALVVTLVVTRDPLRPFESSFGHPWQLSQVEAVELTDRPLAAVALVDYRKLVPADACVGAVLGGDEPSYLLFGPNLEHRIVYLPAAHAAMRAYRHGLFYVVISTGESRWAADQFEAGGWRIRNLGYWLLAVAPGAPGVGCVS
jgi:hypothetical protein